MEEVGQKITPLSINSGRIVLTSLHVYFQPFNNNEVVSTIYSVFTIHFVYIYRLYNIYLKLISDKSI